MISVPYFLLTGVFVLFYYTLFRKHQSVFTCIASMVVVAIYSPLALICLLPEILFLRTIAQIIEGEKDKAFKKALLLVAVVFFCTVTVLAKYLLPGNEQLSLFDTGKLSETSYVFGSSYFVLRFISYVVDVYYGKTHAEKNYFALLQYIMWFPALLQGPVERYGNIPFGKKLDVPFDYDNIRTAGQLLLKGFFKIYVISCYCGLFTGSINDPGEHGAAFLIFSVLMYSVQIYTDFSGGVDIFRGISMLFGINLSENFVRPYFAGGFSNFWSRWHMTFSSWLRDYIYIPLGGNRKGKLRKYLNLIVVFVVSALWHGISVPFLIWGLLHAIYQIAEDLLRHGKKKKEKQSFPVYAVNCLMTFVPVAFAWIFFCADSMKNVGSFFSAMAANRQTSFITEISVVNNFGKMHFIYIGMIVLFFFAEFLHDRYGFDIFAKSASKTKAVFRWTVYICMLAMIVFFGFYGDVYDGANFIYGGF